MLANYHSSTLAFEYILYYEVCPDMNEDVENGEVRKVGLQHIAWCRSAYMYCKRLPLGQS